MKLRLIKKSTEAKDIKSFFFEPEKEINYKPGQFMYFTLAQLKFADSRGATRMFTISSSPTEGRTIRFTTKIRKKSGFKKTLNSLKIGDEISGEGPDGTFILDENEKGGHILIAGGIGITPFRSMIKYSMDKNLKEHLHLMYSNKTLANVAFRSQLEKWASNSNYFKLDMTITKSKDKNNWNHLIGRFTQTTIEKVAERYKNPKFWLCGPPAMVDAFEKLLNNLKTPSSQVRSEKFSGY
jgi:ferredoxin-NADP reductase